MGDESARLESEFHWWPSKEVIFVGMLFQHSVELVIARFIEPGKKATRSDRSMNGKVFILRKRSVVILRWIWGPVPDWFSQFSCGAGGCLICRRRQTETPARRIRKCS
jgi:hypothetical protein